MPTALTIAGSDSGAGAGIQADLKTFAAHGVYGTSAITALTAQNTVGVSAIHVVPDDIVAAQIEAVVTDIGCDAVKTGLLANSTGCVLDLIDQTAAHDRTAGRALAVMIRQYLVSADSRSVVGSRAVDALGEAIALRAG